MIRRKESVVECFSASVGINNLDDLYTHLTHKNNYPRSLNQCREPKRRNNAG